MLIPKVEGRIGQYLGFLERNAYRKLISLDFEIFETEKVYRSPPEKETEWRKIEAPAPWGKPWSCAWFRAGFRAPAGGPPLFLQVLPNADSLAFIDGKPYGAFNLFHKKLRVEADGAEHTLHVEAYAGHPHGGCGPFEGASIVITIGKTIPGFPNTFEGGCLLERLEAVYSLYYDARSLFELSKELDGNSLRKARILKGLYEALTGISFASSGPALEKEAAEAKARIAPLLAAKNGDTVPEIHLIGHAHIDHAWLWPIAETERKAARTFLNMSRFIKEYPEFVFIQTQPCQLEIVKNEYPEIFAGVMEAYKSGNWEPNGGMWVEADCNIPSGESLIRQFLVGKNAVREMFGPGYEADTLWLPDVFGYAAALPQILSGCRIRYFVTSKINWNDTTRFPYETFVWRGIDGTGVNAHFISARRQGYNGRVNPEGLAEIWNEVQHKEIQSAAVKSIGEGDGGGGTLRSDLEMARRFGNLEGAPRAAWKKVSAALESIFAGAGELPEWRGELYLELHRGTYTTQARTKRNNRRLEFALRGTEFLCAAAALDGKAGYPREALLESWKKTLTLQFHDIIPGSSIGRVYEEAEKDAGKILQTLESIRVGTRRALVAENGGGLLAVNDLSWRRRDALRVPASWAGTSARASDGTEYPVQRYVNLDGEEEAVFAPALPPMGWEVFRFFDGAGGEKPPFLWRDTLLETPFYRIGFDGAGRIASLVDLRRDREMVAAGGFFNSLITAEDVPVFWDAWDIDADWTRHIAEETNLVSTELIAGGPVCFRLRRTYRIGTASTLTQDMICYAEDPRIDFETKVEWKERRRLLKAEFDTAIDAAQVRCEVQYGHLFRNTHRNLPQDRAKFEICAHKWISLEEAGGGIALLNDCKYGHDVSGGVMRISLLRSPMAPDMEADQGEHRFSYALLPFGGSFEEAGIIRSAYELNSKAGTEYAPEAGSVKAAARSLCSLDSQAVIIESVKVPEEGNPRTLVLRLYESLGGHTRTTLRLDRDIAAVYLTDMLEEHGEALAFEGSEVPLSFRPFEIKTLLVSFRA